MFLLPRSLHHQEVALGTKAAAEAVGSLLLPRSLQQVVGSLLLQNTLVPQGNAMQALRE